MKISHLAAKACAFVAAVVLALFCVSAPGAGPSPAAVVFSNAGYDLFGAATATDVDTLFVGAPATDGVRGAVHVFYRQRDDFSTWTKHQVLRPNYLGSVVHFGNSIAFAQNTVAIGTFHGPVFI